MPCNQRAATGHPCCRSPAIRTVALQAIVPAQPGFFLHRIWFLRHEVRHSKHPIVAWRVGEPNTYTLPVLGGITDITMEMELLDPIHQAIEHPDGSFAAWPSTGKWYADFAQWRKAIER